MRAGPTPRVCGLLFLKPRPMTIILAGGSGFLGRALQRHLSRSAATVRILTRRPPASASQIQWNPDGTSGTWASALTDADVIVNLAGEGIADRRWTKARKSALRTSRILPARSIAAALNQVAPRRRLVITNCATGFYGAHGDEPITEANPPGDDVLARLCVDWEQEAALAASSTTQVAIIRTGIVLHPSGGALKSMLLPFRLGIGGRLGSGRQYWPWIHLDDWTALVEWLALTINEAHAANTQGTPVTIWNGTAPTPLTNAEFTRALGRVLRRPAILPVPYLALRIALGEFAPFLTTGARVLPDHAVRSGFTFRFQTLEPALRDLL